MEVLGPLSVRFRPKADIRRIKKTRRKAALAEETTVTAILNRLVEKHVKDYKL